MKLFNSVILSGLLVSAMTPSVFAQQQIANSDFEGEWGDCVPYTYLQGEGAGDNTLNTHVVGTQPKGWTISNVAGMASTQAAFGATTVGDSIKGYESAMAVKLTNTPNQFMDVQIVPAYISLGTTWSTAAPSFSFTGISINNSDGGAFGGAAFTERPSGIEFWYKRSRAAAPDSIEDRLKSTYKPDEQSTVVAYLWKGHWTQLAVPTTVNMSGEPTKVDMVDRDRCVLGMDMTGCQGGTVTHTEDAELIAVINKTITENQSEWTKFHADFEYMSDATPENINIIIAAGDYFGGAAAVGRDNELIVDNVTLLYDNKVQTYDGYLNIIMNNSSIAEDKASKIEITTISDTKCSFLLPDLTLVMGGSPLPLGDILLADVDVTDQNSVRTYHGEVKNMALNGGIVADVTLNGTIENEKVNMKIDVVWNGLPIDVTFTTDKLAGIGFVTSEDNAEAEYFNLQGLRVAADALTPGLYIKRQGTRTAKIIVK